MVRLNTPLTLPVLEPERGKDSLTPVQDNQLLNIFLEAYKEYKAYTSLSGSNLYKEEMKIAFSKGLNEKAKIELGYEEPLKPLNRLYEIIRTYGNDCDTEKIERPIHDSFDNKAFSHDL